MLLSCLFTTDEECRAKYERNLAQLARFGIVPRCVKDLLREKAEKRRVLFQCHSKAEKMVLDRLNEINEALTFMDEHDEDHEDVKVKVMLGVKRRIWMKKWANVRKVKADYHCLEFEQHEQQQQQQQQQQHQSKEEILSENSNSINDSEIGLETRSDSLTLRTLAQHHRSLASLYDELALKNECK